MAMDRPHYRGEVSSILPHAQYVLAVQLFPNAFEEGRGYLIDLTTWNTLIPGTDVFSAGILCPADARALAGHLLNAADIADQATANAGAGVTGIRQLPTIKLCGKRFLIDERLRQLRSVENPMHSFDLDDPPMK